MNSFEESDKIREQRDNEFLTQFSHIPRKMIYKDKVKLKSTGQPAEFNYHASKRESVVSIDNTNVLVPTSDIELVSAVKEKIMKQIIIDTQITVEVEDSVDASEIVGFASMKVGNLKMLDGSAIDYEFIQQETIDAFEDNF